MSAAVDTAPQVPAPPGEPARRPGLLARTGSLLRGWADLRHTPYGMTPILVLGALLAVQNFDAGAFTITTPIFVRRGIAVQQVIDVVATVGFVALLFNLAIGYYAERHRRVPLMAVGTALSGVGAAFTGFAHTKAALAIPRAVDGGFSTAGDAPAFALTADYYPPEVRGRAYSLLGAFVRVAAIVSAPITAGLLLLVSLDAFFIGVGAALVAVGVLVAVALREPRRGYMERRSLGIAEEAARVEDEPPSFGEAWRSIFAVRTVRRLFVGDIVGGLGSGAQVFTVLFLADIYGLNTTKLALILLPASLVRVVAGAIGGTAVDRLLGRHPGRALTLYGLMLSVAALGSVAQALEPPLAVLVLVFAVVGIGLAFVGPAASTLYSLVVPPANRTLGLQITNLPAAVVSLVFLPLLGILYTEHGYPIVFYVGAASFVLQGLIYASAGNFFDLDRRAALAVATASQRWAAAREAGTSKMLICHDVDVAYEGVQVLFGVDLEVEEGEIVALLGTNGAGKSTLLRALGGLQEPSGGAIVFAGRDITHMPPYEIARRGVVVMPGGKGIFPDLSVRENLLLGGWTSEDPGQAARALAEVLEIFPALRTRLDTTAGLLSGGEQQQLSLAQAFLMRPKLLLIDELSLGLSPAVVDELVGVVREIHRRGVTVIVVEQSVSVALRLAERAVFMEKGQVRFDGPAADLARRPDIVRAIYVTGGAAVGGVARPPAADFSLAAPVLEARGLTKRFGGITAVDGVDLAVHGGEVVGLIGPNGSGKTTLLDLLSGYLPADSGVVRLRGEDVSGLTPDERARKGLVRRFQDARLFPALTVTEALLVTLERTYSSRSQLLAGLGVPGARRAERRARSRAASLIDLLDLGRYQDTLVGELSTGLRRIVDIACVLASEPDMLLLDEPSTGVARAEAEGLAPLLRRVQRETGCAMLVIEHDMALLRSLADRFVALHQGQVLAEGSPDAVLADERVTAAYLGGATLDSAGGRST